MPRSKIKLSKNFRLGEFEKSQVAIRHDIDNTMPQKLIPNVRALCENVLQPLRDHFGKAVNLSSGYRSPLLNKKIGGSRTSDHKKGCAADIEITDVDNLITAWWLRENIEFDQLISEYYVKGDPTSGWVHVSYRTDRPNRKQVLTKIAGRRGYIPGLQTLHGPQNIE